MSNYDVYIFETEIVNVHIITLSSTFHLSTQTNCLQFLSGKGRSGQLIRKQTLPQNVPRKTHIHRYFVSSVTTQTGWKTKKDYFEIIVDVVKLLKQTLIGKISFNVSDE